MYVGGGGGGGSSQILWSISPIEQVSNDFYLPLTLVLLLANLANTI